MKRALKLAYQWWRMALADPRKLLRFPGELARYRADLRLFRRGRVRDAGPIELQPVLFQKNIPSSFDAHYVYQAAWAIRRIVSLRPPEHVDISSNIPYVAALSAVVPVRFCEFRPPRLQLPGLSLQHASITELPFASRSVPSLSCLHVLEHIGLGRYGDPVDPEGLEKACRELARVCAPGGALFLSLPVGRARVCFNAHRVSDPLLLPRLLGAAFTLESFCVVTDEGLYLESERPERFADQSYACGLYHFSRSGDA